MMLEKLRKKEPFQYSRWGDGEWQCVLGYEGQNCDGHRYFPSLRMALIEVLRDNPKYYMGMQPKAYRTMDMAIDPWCDVNEVNIDWCNADILHDASIAGRLDEFLKLLSTGRVFMVSHDRICSAINNEVARRFMSDLWICFDIPLNNCWNIHEGLLHELSEYIGMQRPPVILYCASMMSKVLIHKINQMFGDTITQIDCGSVFDPYAGYATRRYHQAIIDREKK